MHALDRVTTFTSEDGRPAWQHVRLLTASYSEELLDTVDTALEQRTPEDQQILGEAFGYPQTATDAFVQGHSVGARSVTQDAELLAFAMYNLSPEHAQSELSTARSWAEQVQAVSPAIYQQQMEEYHAQ